MFDFLNGMFLYGLAGVSFPLLIHLFLRPKFRVVRFSSIAFLKRILEESARRFRFQKSFLLFLRTLTVLFLVLGFSQPVWRGPGSRVLPMAPEHAMVFLDVSASMQRPDLGEKVKERVREVLEQISPKSEIHLWEIGRTPKEKIGTKEALLREIQSLSPSDQRGNVLRALHQGISFLEKSGASYSEVFLISDFQRSGFSAGGKGLDENRFKQWKGVLYAIPVLGEQANLAIEDAGLALLPGASGYSLRVFAKIRNWDEEEKETLVRFFIHGHAVAQKTILIKPGECVFETVPVSSLERGFIEGKVELESDAFPLDNTRFFCGFVPERIRILLVGHDVSDVRPYQWVLGDAQGPDSLFQIQIRTASDPWVSLLDETEIFILSNYDELSFEQAQAIQRYLEKGKSVWIVLGNRVKLDVYNQRLFLPCWGDSLQLPLKRLTSNGYFTLGHVDLEGPFFQGVFQAHVKRIPSPHFFQTVQFHGDSFRPILRLSNGEPLLTEFSYREGEGLVLGTGLEKDWSDLAYSNLFAPLVYRTIQYLSQSRDQKVGYALVGEPLTLFLPGSRHVASPRIEVILPSGEKETLLPEFHQGRLVAHFFSTESPGIYRFEEREKPFGLWAVNVDPEESDFRPISKDALSAFFPNARILWVDPGVSIAFCRTGVSLWKLLFLFVLGFLFTESFFSQWRERHKNPKRRG